MSECIYCGSTEHDVVDSVVGFVRLCQQAPTGVPTLSPAVVERMGAAANAVINIHVSDAITTLAKRKP